MEFCKAAEVVIWSIWLRRCLLLFCEELAEPLQEAKDLDCQKVLQKVRLR